MHSDMQAYRELPVHPEARPAVLQAQHWQGHQGVLQSGWISERGLGQRSPLPHARAGMGLSAKDFSASCGGSNPTQMRTRPSH